VSHSTSIRKHETLLNWPQVTIKLLQVVNAFHLRSSQVERETFCVFIIHRRPRPPSRHGKLSFLFKLFAKSNFCGNENSLGALRLLLLLRQPRSTCLPRLQADDTFISHASFPHLRSVEEARVEVYFETREVQRRQEKCFDGVLSLRGIYDRAEQ
jgi:hypothetical protein